MVHPVRPGSIPWALTRALPEVASSPTSVKECRTPPAVKRDRLVVKSSVKIKSSDPLSKQRYRYLWIASLYGKDQRRHVFPPFSPAVLCTHRAQTVSLLLSRVVEHHSVEQGQHRLSTETLLRQLESTPDWMLTLDS